MATTRKKAVFVDRDGTVMPDLGYLATPAGVTLFPGVGEGLRRLREKGFLLVMVTNQSGVGRGYFSLDDLAAVHRRLFDLLLPFGVVFDEVQFCPHAPEAECECRKPRPGMLLRAAEKLNIDLAASFMIGDSPADMGAGKAAGCRTICVGPGACAQDMDFHAPNFPGAVDWILEWAVGGAPS